MNNYHLYECGWLLALLSSQFKTQQLLHEQTQYTKRRATAGAAVSPFAAEPEDEEVPQDCPTGEKAEKEGEDTPSSKKSIRSPRSPSSPSSKKSEATMDNANERRSSINALVDDLPQKYQTQPSLKQQDWSPSGRRKSLSSLSSAERKMAKGLARMQTMRVMREQYRDMKMRSKKGERTWEAWWHWRHIEKQPRYVSPMEKLMLTEPHLFDVEGVEDVVIQLGGSPRQRGPCPRCHEDQSTNGWGNPSCLVCGGVEELCMPFREHLFGSLCVPGQLQEGRRSSRKSSIASDVSLFSGEISP